MEKRVLSDDERRAEIDRHIAEHGVKLLPYGENTELLAYEHEYRKRHSNGRIASKGKRGRAPKGAWHNPTRPSDRHEHAREKEVRMNAYVFEGPGRYIGTTALVLAEDEKSARKLAVSVMKEEWRVDGRRVTPSVLRLVSTHPLDAAAVLHYDDGDY
jgi:hypothetical protein